MNFIFLIFLFPMYPISLSVKQFLLFIMVGALNTLFGYVVFCLFIFLKMHYALSLFLATVIGVIFNFGTTGKIVFKNVDNKLFIRFVLVYAVLYLINVTFLKLCSYIWDNFYLCGGISTCSTALIAFFMNKYLVFQSGTKKTIAETT